MRQATSLRPTALVLIGIVLLSMALLCMRLPVRADTLWVTNPHDSGAGTLRAALAVANPGDVIRFDLSSPVTITLTSGPLDVTQPVIIQGPGATLLTLRASSAGGRVMNATAPLTIMGVTIRDGMARGDGGGILTSQALTLANCIVSDCSADNGGGIYCMKELLLEDTEIANNHAAGFGGGAYCEGPVSVNGGTMARNEAQQNGGGLCALDDVTLVSATFISNTTEGWGGAIMADHEHIAMDETTLSENSAYAGGAVRAAHVDAIDCAITDNWASMRAGGVYCSGNITMTGGLVSGNVCEGYDGGGGGLLVTGATLDAVDIISNTSEYGGGISTGYLVMVDSRVLSNTAQDRAGGIQVIQAAEIHNCVISGNRAITRTAGGIASWNAVVTMTHTTVSDNHAGQDGGGIHAWGSLFLDHVDLVGNTAGQSGGGLSLMRTFASDWRARLTDCRIMSNTATWEGGGVAAADGVLEIASSTFVHNYGQGGGLNVCSGESYWTGTAARVTNCTFSGNIGIGGHGAGIHAQDTPADPVRVDVLHCTISGNAAEHGAGIMSLDAQFTLTNTLVAGNTATTSGPDIYGFVGSGGGNLVGDDTTSSGLIHGLNGDQIGTSGSPIDPLLGELGDYGGDTFTIPLLPGSPAIDAGVVSSVTHDQRGLPRFGAPDVGAYEVQGMGQQSIVWLPKVSK